VSVARLTLLLTLPVVQSPNFDAAPNFGTCGTILVVLVRSCSGSSLQKHPILLASCLLCYARTSPTPVPSHLPAFPAMGRRRADADKLLA